MNIGELARRFGLQPSALRYYERKGLLPKPGRVGGRRFYHQAAVDRLGFIREAQASGLTLAEIGALLRDSAMAWPRVCFGSRRWSERSRTSTGGSKRCAPAVRLCWKRWSANAGRSRTANGC